MSEEHKKAIEKHGNFIIYISRGGDYYYYDCINKKRSNPYTYLEGINGIREILLRRINKQMNVKGLIICRCCKQQVVTK